MHHQDWVGAVAFSPDGKLILTGSRDQTARLWEAGTGKPVGAPLVHQGGVQGRGFCPGRQHDRNRCQCQRRAALGCGHAQADWVNCSCIRTTWIPWHSARTARSSPAGAMTRRSGSGRPRPASRCCPFCCMVAPSQPLPSRLTVNRCSRRAQDQTVRLWEVGTGDPFGTPLRHQGILMAVAFSPDGKTVLTASMDKTARLWDATTGRELRQFRGHQGGVWIVAYSPDGKTILTGSTDGTAQLWNVDTGEPIHHAAEI